MFVKGMEANVYFTMKPGDVPTGASPSLGGGLQLFHCLCVILATRSVQNRDAWIQELMFQLRIVQAGPLKQLLKGHLQKGHLASRVWEVINTACM